MQSTGTVDTPPQAFRPTTGGNPGSYRHINHISASNQIFTHHRRAGAIYDPGASGAIASIDFSVDLRAIQNFANINVAIRLLIEQGGEDYWSSTFVINNSATWANRTASYTSASQFRTFASAAAHPDWSLPFQLGFTASNDNAGMTATRSVGVDNWSVTINQVPAPSVAAGAVALLLVTRRRRPPNTER